MSRQGKRRSVVTLRQVAEAADVHPGTVSRALNPTTRDLVNADTAARVDEIARRLGYKPNPLARGLKTRRSQTIGVLLPDLTNPLFPPIVLGIEDRLRQDTYTALLANTEYDSERLRSGFEALLARHVDGFILATATRFDPLIHEAAAAHVPLVLVNRGVDDASVPSVTPDDRGGVTAAVQHLVELGHRRIGHVAGPLSTSTGQARLDGFLTAAMSNGLEAGNLVEVAAAFNEEAGEEQARSLLEAHPGITAIIAANDLIALGCLSAFAAAGLRCPEDVSVVGFNDMPFIDKLNPPLTSVRIPHHEMGFRAADLLLAQLDDDVSPEQIRLPVELIVRGSTGPPPAAAAKQ